MRKPKRAESNKDALFVGAILALSALILLTIMNARIARIYREPIPIDSQLITPVVKQNQKNGLQTFLQPGYGFSFMYPDSWEISLVKTTPRDTHADLALRYRVGSQTYKAHFMRGGRGTVAFDSVKRDTVTYGGHTAYKNTYIQDGKPVQVVITFRDMNLIKPYISIAADLPATKANEYETLIEQVASSIKKIK